MRTDRQRQPARRSSHRHTTDVHDPNATVGEYLIGWLDGRQSLRPSTRLAYQIHLNRYLLPHLGHIRLTRLSLADVERMYRDIDTHGVGGRRLEAATLRRIHATLMSALTSAVRRGLLERNPARYAELPRAPRPRMQVWTAQQLAGFLDSVGGERLAALFRLIALTGLRRGEAIGLRWVDVDLETGVLQVEQQIVAVGSERHIGPPKSSNGRRHVALPARLSDELREHQRRQHRDRLAAGQDWHQSGLVFTTETGDALAPGHVTRDFTRLVRAAGLPPIRLHDLRHLSASLGLESGETLLEVSRRLGHSSITITADIYGHIAPSTARQSADRLDQLIHDLAPFPHRRATENETLDPLTTSPARKAVINKRARPTAHVGPGFRHLRRPTARKGTPMRHRSSNAAHTIIHAARTVLHSISEQLRRVWHAHRRLLRTNPAYAAAVVAGVSAVIRQESLLDLAAALGATLLAIYSATRRGLARP